MVPLLSRAHHATWSVLEWVSSRVCAEIQSRDKLIDGHGQRRIDCHVKRVLFAGSFRLPERH